jgi:predicted dehydrogenase
MNVAIIGCGVVGQKRLRALGNGFRLVAAADAAPERAAALASACPGAVALSDWRAAVAHPAVEAVLVATTNNWLAPITRAAVEAGKHVLVEKPAALTPAELDPIIPLAGRNRVCVQVGFNHRYHPALRKAHEIASSGGLGPLLFVRARYGHGGRKGYEKEWRANPEVSGGGELIDQGVHLIDLARWFLGDCSLGASYSPTYFWPMPVEDNAFLMLRTPRHQVAWLHASSTEWKNLFSFEVYGRDAKLHVEGLGGSYGVERLSYYQMRPEMGPPDTTIWEYPGEDGSWRAECEAFARCVQEARPADASLADARAALAIVEAVYRQAGS